MGSHHPFLGTTDEGIQKTTSLLQKKELSTNQHKPFGLARIEGSFAKYLQTPHYMKLHLQAVIRAEISGNDPRPKLTSPSLSQVPNRLGMIEKIHYTERTFSDQLDNPTLPRLNSSARTTTVQMQGCTSQGI